MPPEPLPRPDALPLPAPEPWPEPDPELPQQAVLEAIPEAAGVLANGRFSAANGAMESLFGKGRVRVAARHFRR